MMISANFYQIMFWTVPALCLQCWIEKFNEDSKTQQVLYTCQYYQKLHGAFSYFLLLLYVILQILSIVHLFTSIANSLKNESNFPGYLMFSGFVISLGRWVIFRDD